MRIAYVTMEYIDPETYKVIDGGLANYLYKVTNTISGMGHKIIVFVVNCTENKHIKFNDIDIYYLKKNFKRTFWQNFYWIFLTGKIKKKIKADYMSKVLHNKIKKINKQNKIDIIQYTTCTNTAKYPEKEIPSVLRISSYAKLRQESYKYKNLEELAKDEELYKVNKFIFGPSKHIADYIKNDLNLHKEIKIIESPYSKEVIKEDNSILEDLKNRIQNNPYLLFFGTIGELKGCKVIADCIYDVLEKYRNLYMVLVGKNATFINDTDYAQLIKDNAKEFSDRVIRYQSLSHEKLYPLIRSAQSVLMPSLTENFSNACVEAMRLRKIVIGTEGNFSQLITDDVSGFLAKVGNSDSLKEKIIELMDLTTDKKTEMETNAYQRTENLSPEKICTQLIDYYKDVINNWQ